MNNIGGNLPILVEPTRKEIGFRESLYIYYAGFYGISEYTAIKFQSHWKKKTTTLSLLSSTSQKHENGSAVSY